MKHTTLSADSDTHYGVGWNSDKTHVLLQLGEGFDQVRVRLTTEEVDRLINGLQRCKNKLIE